MISNVICQMIHSIEPSLVEGTNLFAEKAFGNQQVLVRTTHTEPVLEDTTQIRRSTFQVLLTGYGIGEGDKLAQQISKSLNDKFGDYSYKDEQYKVFSVYVRNLPVNFENEGINYVSINAIVSYSIVLP